MQLLEFHLHVFSHLQVKGSEGFVQQEHFGIVDNSAGNGDTLLLATGKGIHVAILIVGHSYHFQSSLYLFLDDGRRKFFQFETESNVVKHIQVGKKCVLLKYGIYRTQMGRRFRYFLSADAYFAL